MARTDATAVGKIIEVQSGDDIAPFIEAANMLVTQCCASDTDYDSTKLELIERWLSAHFYAVRNPRATMEKAGDVSETLQSKVDLGLNVTHYGQMAMRLDYKGGLANLENSTKKGFRRKVGITYLGTAPEDETPL